MRHASLLLPLAALLLVPGTLAAQGGRSAGAAVTARSIESLRGNTLRFGKGEAASYLYLRPDGVARVREGGVLAEDQIWSVREDGKMCLTDHVGYRCAAVQVGQDGGVALLPEQDRQMSGTLLRGNPQRL